MPKMVPDSRNFYPSLYNHSWNFPLLPMRLWDINIIKER